MILVFGGTTEGRKAAEVLEEAGTTYYYSTKTGEQDLTLHHGERIDGALDREAMLTFCRQHDIRLLVDAAHPFATALHLTVADVARQTAIPVVRYERIYPPRDPDITWIDDYSEVPRDIRSLLATTGVQSIAKLKPLETGGMKVFYRILPRESSVRLAHAQGATDSQLVFYDDSNVIGVSADAILLKESGLSGGFPEKVAAARQQGMRIIALKRPEITQRSTFDIQHSTITGPHGLRRTIEKLLPDFFPLKSGLTTGTCATAAAVAAATRLLRGEMPTEVPVILPDGETIHVAVGYGDGFAYCIKEAGDDPDVTNGIEIRATITTSDAPGITIEGGEGIGRFTLPGFDYPPGAPAINRTPRKMIEENLSTFNIQHSAFNIAISAPEGAEIARRTFNPRLGIKGGISIIGVSGIVKPFSEEAFIQSIRKCMEVAKASGTSRVVLNSGAKSERFLKARFPELPPQAFVHYGNYIGETLRMAAELHMPDVTLGVMLGKAVKLAEGQLDTHSRRGTMNLDFIQQMLTESKIQTSIFNLQNSTITLARELWDIIPPDQLPAFVHTVIAHCAHHCRPLLPDGHLTIFLIDDNGHVFGTD